MGSVSDVSSDIEEGDPVVAEDETQVGPGLF